MWFVFCCTVPRFYFCRGAWKLLLWHSKTAQLRLFSFSSNVDCCFQCKWHFNSFHSLSSLTLQLMFHFLHLVIKWHSSYFQSSHALNHFDSSAEIWMTFIGYKSNFNLLSSLSVQTPESEQIVLTDFLAACSLENTVNKKCALSGARQLFCSWLLPDRYQVTVLIALENQCSFRHFRHIINEHDYRHTALPYRCEVRRCFWFVLLPPPVHPLSVMRPFISLALQQHLLWLAAPHKLKVWRAGRVGDVSKIEKKS